MCLVKLNNDIINHMNNTSRNTVFTYLLLCFLYFDLSSVQTDSANYLVSVLEDLVLIYLFHPYVTYGYVVTVFCFTKEYI